MTKYLCLSLLYMFFYFKATIKRSNAMFEADRGSYKNSEFFVKLLLFWNLSKQRLRPRALASDYSISELG